MVHSMAQQQRVIPLIETMGLQILNMHYLVFDRKYLLTFALEHWIGYHFIETSFDLEFWSMPLRFIKLGTLTPSLCI